jgi:arylsulfatase B
MAIKMALHFVALALASASVSASGAPNILFYLIDDLGWGDLSLSALSTDRTAGGHSTFSTPNIDKLAREGVVLDKYYVNQLCSPTRTSLLSARYAYHLGLAGGVITDGHPETLRLNESTIAESLKSLGYRTHAIGKWDAGYTTPRETPTGRGFDTFTGYYNADEDYYTHSCGGAGAHPGCHGLDLHEDHVDPVTGELVLRALNDTTTHSTILYTRAIQAIIERRDPVSLKPFFIYAAYQAVHGPLEAPAQYVAMCEDEGEPSRQLFCGMIKALDEGIGNISSSLLSHGYGNSTLIAFSTDNGGQNAVGGNNWPLRGNKATVFEGGVRGTGFLWGAPLSRTGAGGGRLWTGMMHNVDWFPTLTVAAGGVPPPTSAAKDGVSVWEALVAGAESPRTEMLLQLTGPRQKGYTDDYQLTAAYRRGKWKVVFWEREAPCANSTNISAEIATCGKRATGWVEIVGDHRAYLKPTPEQSCYKDKPCLFDIDADPLEKTDLGSAHPDVLNELLGDLARYNASQIPDQSYPFDQAACPKPPSNAWMPWKNDTSTRI